MNNSAFPHLDVNTLSISAHNSAYTGKYVTKEGLPEMDWAPRSLDTNCIENFWGLLQCDSIILIEFFYFCEEVQDKNETGVEHDNTEYGIQKFDYG